MKKVRNMAWMTKQMLILAVIVFYAVALSASESHSPDPTADKLASRECKEAQLGLEQAFEAALSNPRQGAGQQELERRKNIAAERCLGNTGSQQPARGLQMPSSASPAKTDSLPPARPRASVAPTPAPVITQPSRLTACDAGGCWDDKGVRLPQNGLLLQGTNGPCIPQGAMFICP